MTKSIALASALAFALTGFGAAFAAEGDQSVNLKMLNSAKVSVTQAIQVAETATGGRATGAAFATPNGKPLYEVSVLMSDGRVKSLEVDAKTGRVVQDVADTENGEAGGPDQPDQD